MSDFAGLRVALSALQAAQQGVDVASQNIANANTDGYSRQRVDLVNVGAPAQPALWSTYNGTGGGVRVDTITRFRDAFMEIQAALEHGSAASLDQGSTTMNAIQQLFNEPSDTGIQSQLSDFWSGWDTVANNPSEPAARTQLVEQANTLAASINGVSQQLTQQRTDTISQLGATVANINQMAQSLAQLNKSIKANTIANLPVNDLEDQRDLLANQLATASGASLQSTQFNQVNVVLNGTALVQEGTSQTLTVDSSGSPVVLRWTNGNAVATVNSGKAGGELTAINTTIPSYLTKINTVATTLRDEVNQLHSAITGSIATYQQDQSASGNLQFDIALDGGAFATATVAGADWSGAGGAAALQTALQNSVDAAIGAGNATVTVSGGNGSDLSVSIVPSGTHQLQVQATGTNAGFGTLLGTTPVGSDGIGGRAFFTGTDALTLAVSNQIANDPNALAAGTAAGGPLDSSNALAMAQLSESTTGADTAYQQLIVQLGVDTQTATNRDQIQQAATTSLDNARAQVSGVNTDEEMTDLVQYQHSYEAAARVMSTIDSMLNTLINNTGLGS